MEELIKKKKIVQGMLEKYDFEEDEFEFLIEVLEIIKDRIVRIVEEKVTEKVTELFIN